MQQKMQKKRRLLKYVSKITNKKKQEANKTIHMVRNKIITNSWRGAGERKPAETGQANFFREI